MSVFRKFCILFYLFCFSNLSFGQGFFVENKGQYPDSVLFGSTQNNVNYYLTKKGIVIDVIKAEHYAKLSEAHSNKNSNLINEPFDAHAYFIEFNNANTISVEPRLKLKGTYNYFLGNIKATNVKRFQQIVLNDIWPGISAKFYFAPNGNFKYDFKVKPGVNPNKIQLIYHNTDEISIENKELKVLTSVSESIEKKPFSYFLEDNQEQDINWVIKDNTVFRF